ncbi:conserved hypothetical protein [Theileria equi strain WA]|uniref:Toxoplasma gondii family A protein n=1 Tax=Theileria equi strain WA TaxID=1537102 RepID=L1LAH8_THEEQ|nr:conserved hypothetical protein [Theileria equi strain WA]EKX72270.1 conserved hypothetical protein [Theileria equi strain WA]|eukprot:XP_004831722.1 conserved hypothetical protein [Theileria equi strain WA]
MMTKSLFGVAVFTYFAVSSVFAAAQPSPQELKPVAGPDGLQGPIGPVGKGLTAKTIAKPDPGSARELSSGANSTHDRESTGKPEESERRYDGPGSAGFCPGGPTNPSAFIHTCNPKDKLYAALLSPQYSGHAEQLGTGAASVDPVASNKAHVEEAEDKISSSRQEGADPQPGPKPGEGKEEEVGDVGDRDVEIQQKLEEDKPLSLVQASGLPGPPRPETDQGEDGQADETQGKDTKGAVGEENSTASQHGSGAQNQGHTPTEEPPAATSSTAVDQSQLQPEALGAVELAGQTASTALPEAPQQPDGPSPPANITQGNAQGEDTLTEDGEGAGSGDNSPSSEPTLSTFSSPQATTSEAHNPETSASGDAQPFAEDGGGSPKPVAPQLGQDTPEAEALTGQGSLAGETPVSSDLRATHKGRSAQSGRKAGDASDEGKAGQHTKTDGSAATVVQPAPRVDVTTAAKIRNGMNSSFSADYKAVYDGFSASHVFSAIAVVFAVALFY